MKAEQYARVRFYHTVLIVVNISCSNVIVVFTMQLNHVFKIVCLFGLLLNVTTSTCKNHLSNIVWFTMVWSTCLDVFCSSEYWFSDMQVKRCLLTITVFFQAGIYKWYKCCWKTSGSQHRTWDPLKGSQERSQGWEIINLQTQGHLTVFSPQIIKPHPQQMLVC